MTAKTVATEHVLVLAKEPVRVSATQLATTIVKMHVKTLVNLLAAVVVRDLAMAGNLMGEYHVFPSYFPT